jgi:hypothetical protein
LVVDGVFEPASGEGVVFRAAIGPEPRAIARAQGSVRQRRLRLFARRGLLPRDETQAMGQWEDGGGFSVDSSVRVEAADRAGPERLLRSGRRKSPITIDSMILRLPYFPPQEEAEDGPDGNDGGEDADLVPTRTYDGTDDVGRDEYLKTEQEVRPQLLSN